MYSIFFSILLFGLTIFGSLKSSVPEEDLSLVSEKKRSLPISDTIESNKKLDNNEAFLKFEPQIVKFTKQNRPFVSYADRQMPCLDALIVADNKQLLMSAIWDKVSNLYITNNRKETPIHLAIRHGHNDILVPLLQVSNPAIDVNAQAYDGQTAVHYAVFHDNRDALLLLYQYGANFEIKDMDKVAPLLSAAKLNRQGCAEILMEMGVDVTTQDKFGYQPLHFADSPSLAGQLISRGASVNAKGRFGHTPAAMAVIQSRHDVLPFLLDQKSSVDYLDTQGNNLLCYARNKNVAQLLMGQGLSPHHKNQKNQTALHYLAKRCRSSEIIQALIDNDADVDARDFIAKTPLHYVTNPENASMLLEHGANVNHKVIFFDKKIFVNDTPLSSWLKNTRQRDFYAPWADTTKVLVEKGAKTYGQSGIKFATKYSWKDHVAYLNRCHQIAEHKRKINSFGVHKIHNKTVVDQRGSYPTMEEID